MHIQKVFQVSDATSSCAQQHTKTSLSMLIPITGTRGEIVKKNILGIR